MTGPTLTGGRCQCPACGVLFTSGREFDRHRTGTYAKPGEWQGERHCLSVADLESRGWRKNARGFWMQPRPQRAPAGIQGARMLQAATQVAGVIE